MTDRGRLWTLLACLAVVVLVLSFATLSPGDGGSGATVSTGNGVACGAIGENPTRAEVERLAARQTLSPEATANLLGCFGFSASDSN
jgi:hypothetical protein